MAKLRFGISVHWSSALGPAAEEALTGPQEQKNRTRSALQSPSPTTPFGYLCARPCPHFRTPRHRHAAPLAVGPGDLSGTASPLLLHFPTGKLMCFQERVSRQGCPLAAISNAPQRPKTLIERRRKHCPGAVCSGYGFDLILCCIKKHHNKKMLQLWVSLRRRKEHGRIHQTKSS